MLLNIWLFCWKKFSFSFSTDLIAATSQLRPWRLGHVLRVFAVFVWPSISRRDWLRHVASQHARDLSNFFTQGVSLLFLFSPNLASSRPSSPFPFQFI